MKRRSELTELRELAHRDKKVLVRVYTHVNKGRKYPYSSKRQQRHGSEDRSDAAAHSVNR